MPKKIIFDKKNVLVIGGAGFIGSHLCDELIKNAKVICIDNFLTGSEKNIDHLLAEPNFEFIRHDINSPIELGEFPELQKFKIEFQGVQEIYYLACPMSPKNFLKNRINIILSNSYGIKNALDMAVKYKASFMHFSSSVVYGLGYENKSKLDEGHEGRVNILSDRSAYDEGKRFAETIVYNYYKKFGLDAKIARLFRIYGPRMKLADDQMIPDFISNALDDKDFQVFGDKNFSSSFCYISDCIDGVMRLMGSNFFGPINIGSDIDVKLIDLAQKIIDKIGSKSKINFSDEILFISPLCLPDITKAKNELGWMPLVSLEKGLGKTIYELRASKGLKGF
ncbi:MAG: NAD-dependent epimerase/dehydratase family protein [Patescibacteria group bacterium]|nr:NAD-dependent epimerase/dehydratase family protein [Patescibacteria group bacterium]